MLKMIAGVILGSVLLSGEAMATCGGTWHTLTNGTTADANQVMDNFNCVFQTPVFSGSVGIGMTPSNVLDITQTQNGDSAVSLLNGNAGSGAVGEYRASNGTHAAEFVIYGTGYSTSGVSRQDGTLLGGNGAGGLTLWTGAPQPIYFAVNSSEIGRFGTDGSFLVNTTTNGGWAGNSKLEVKITTAANAVSGYAAGTSGTALLARVDNTAAYLAAFFFSSASQVGSITTNGSSTAYNTTSDRRLKTHVKRLDAPTSLKALRAYDPSSFYLHGAYGVGGIAQWVDAKMKAIGIDAAAIGLVHRGDNDIHRRPTDPGFRQWQMDSSKMVPYAIRTILDQEDRIETLEKANNSLTEDVRRLRRLEAANGNRAREIDDLKTRIDLLEKRIDIKTARN